MSAPGRNAWRTALRLGRVSNLPTVWSNVIAATALAGGAPVKVVAALGAAMSLLYVGGMFLNDAYDSAVDARERADRPIPSGEISARTVFAAGYALLAAGAAMLAAIDLRAGALGLALVAAIVIYDRHHKGNPLSPWVMGMCRALVYVTAGVAASASFGTPVLIGALALLVYVAGVTYAARLEAFDRIGALWPLALLAAPLVVAAPQLTPRPVTALALAALATVAWQMARLLRRRAEGDVARVVALLIAAIAINDALLAATTHDPRAALACLICFGATLVLQRHVPAT